MSKFTSAHSDAQPQHIRKTALDELIRCAKASFGEEELFYLSTELEVAALDKYSARLMADDSWTGIE